MVSSSPRSSAASSSATCATDPPLVSGSLFAHHISGLRFDARSNAQKGGVRMDALMNALDFRLYGAEMKDWVVAVVAALAVTAALRLAQAYAIRKLRSHATSTEHPTIAFAV